jgi:hypothetical protein
VLAPDRDVVMSTRADRRRLPLRGADLVLMAMHHRWKRAGISENALLVVETDTAVEPERVRRALARFVEECPWVAARLARPLPWGKLAWTRAGTAAPPVHHERVQSRVAFDRAIGRELNAGIDPRREAPLRARVLDLAATDGEARGALVLAWFHPLMDPRGAQNLLARLTALDGGDAATVSIKGVRPDTSMASPAPPHTRAPDARPLGERGVIARRSLAYMRDLVPVPPTSPGAGRVPTGRVAFRRVAVEDHDRWGARGGPRDAAWRLAVVGRAMAALWHRRGLPDTPFVVPVAVDLRPKGAPGPTIGNDLAFHFARFRPSDAADTAALAAALRAQMADAVRDGQIEANAVAMDFLSYRPLSMMLRALPWARAGDAFSFNCADVGGVPRALERVFGRRVVNAYHVPSVVPRPGVGVFFNRCGPTDNAVVAWAEGAVDDVEAEAILRDVSAAPGDRADIQPIVAARAARR